MGLSISAFLWILQILLHPVGLRNSGNVDFRVPEDMACVAVISFLQPLQDLGETVFVNEESFPVD